MERTDKGSFSLGDFDNKKKWEGFDASRFLNPTRALYKRVGYSGLCNEHIPMKSKRDLAFSKC